MVSQVLRTAGQGDAEALAGSAGVGGVAGAGAGGGVASSACPSLGTSTTKDEAAPGLPGMALYADSSEEGDED